MSDYRRWYVPGGTYFFTVVTYGRYPFFGNPQARKLLGESIRTVLKERPFELVASILLPDHLHCLWSLPPGDDDYAGRWKAIKDKFTTDWLATGGHEEPVTPSQLKRGNRGIWQRRYHEHNVRDEFDLEIRFDYIHYNAVRHRYVRTPAAWKWSTFHRYVAAGHYPVGWGRTEPAHLKDVDFE